LGLCKKNGGKDLWIGMGVKGVGEAGMGVARVGGWQGWGSNFFPNFFSTFLKKIFKLF
jgi:hypothetical protein